MNEKHLYLGVDPHGSPGSHRKPNAMQGETTKSKKKVILFTEDKSIQMYGVVTPLEKTGIWSVIRCSGRNETLKELEKASETKEYPDVVSLDLGIDGKDESPERGLDLLKTVRKRWQGLPIIIHSALEVNEPTVREVVAQKASYFYLRDKGDVEEYIEILPFVAKGYLIYSQKPAAQLPRVVTRLPDPFFGHPEYWKTLEWLDKGLIYSQIAERDESAKTEKGIMARVKRMVFRLESLDEVPELPDPEAMTSDTYKRVVIKWYQENKNRSGR